MAKVNSFQHPLINLQRALVNTDHHHHHDQADEFTSKQVVLPRVT